jgi:hypothetical protein
MRAVLRKAFLDMEGVLSDWDEASNQGLQVLRALQNASDRLRDFTAAEGGLGILSQVEDAEKVLRDRLIRSIERLHRALQPQMSALAAARDKMQKIIDNVVQEMLDLQAECDPARLWSGAYPGQPSIAEMQEWLQDWVSDVSREYGAREMLMKGIGSDDGLKRAIDLWDARLFFDPDRTNARADAVKIHVTTAI